MAGIESIFDQYDSETIEAYKIWRKVKSQDCVCPSPKEILYEGWLCRLDPTDDEHFQERYFIATKDRLYYKRKPSDTACKAFLSLSFMRLVLTDLIGAEKVMASELRLRFIRNHKFTDLYARTSSEMESWVSALAPLVICTDFHDQYKVKNIIGSGAFGKVYLAEHYLGQQFAVKTFSKSKLASGDKGISGLMNEIDILRSLNHPNIMSLQEVNETTNSIYMVCELLEAGTLADFLKAQDNYLSEDDVAIIVVGLLDALTELSAKGIVHRDIKPENILLSSSNQLLPQHIKLADFGLATRISQNLIFSRCGTPGFVAPEVADRTVTYNSTTISAKSDIFSVGILTYLLLTGQYAFGNGSNEEVLRRTTECIIDFDLPILKGKSIYMIEFLKAVLSKDPAKRPTAEQVIKFKLFDNLRHLLASGKSDMQECSVKPSIQTSSIKCDADNYANSDEKVKSGSNNLKVACTAITACTSTKSNRSEDVDHSSIEIIHHSDPSYEKTPNRSTVKFKSTVQDPINDQNMKHFQVSTLVKGSTF